MTAPEKLVERVHQSLSTLDPCLDDDEVVGNLLATPAVADELAGLVWEAYREAVS
jgi:hypothetical protein